MKNNIKKTVCIAVALVVQCAAIGWLIGRYENIVRNGAEVRFRCAAYDPYDPLRGRYLRTNVRESCTNFVGFAATEENRWDCRDKFFVRLEPSTNGLWRVSAAALEPQDDGGIWAKPISSRAERSVSWENRGKDESSADFENRRAASPFKVTFTFPDQLFVNERVAPAAEGVLREMTSSGKAVAVYRVKGSEIVMTGIEVDGKSIVAGRIGVENLADVLALGPDVVDVNSSLETAPGVKSANLLAAFLAEFTRQLEFYA